MLAKRNDLPLVAMSPLSSGTVGHHGVVDLPILWDVKIAANLPATNWEGLFDTDELLFSSKEKAEDSCISADDYEKEEDLPQSSLMIRDILDDSEDTSTNSSLSTHLLGSGNAQEVCSWSNDKQSRLYNLVEEVRDLIVRGLIIYTVRDRDVVVTELTGNKGRYATRATMEGSSPMVIVGNKLCFASRTAVDICVHENSKQSRFKQLKQFKAHDMILNALAGQGDSILYSGSWDKTVKRWDLNTFECTGTCDVGTCVSSLAVGDQGEVYAAGSNGHICRIDSK